MKAEQFNVRSVARRSNLPAMGAVAGPKIILQKQKKVAKGVQGNASQNIILNDVNRLEDLGVSEAENSIPAVKQSEMHVILTDAYATHASEIQNQKTGASDTKPARHQNDISMEFEHDFLQSPKQNKNYQGGHPNQKFSNKGLIS